MKILITGAEGQLGWELTEAYTNKENIELFSLNREQLDLKNPDQICGIMREIKPDLIFNPAAYTAVDRAEQEPDLAHAINGLAPGILAEEANRCDALLIHYSTDYVFDGAATKPYVETDATAPVSVYGKTKLQGELAVAATAKRYAIFRTSWLYGNRRQNFFLTMLRLANERSVLSVVGDQCGSPTWVHDVATVSSRMVRAEGKRPELRADSGLYHLTASGETTWHGFAAAIFENTKDKNRKLEDLRSITTDQYPTPAKRPAYSVLSSKKISRALGEEPRDWRSQLQGCLEERALIEEKTFGTTDKHR